MDLGRPIGEHTHASLPQGEHGAGTGLSGGYGTATSQNTQAGQFAQSDRFNAGLGGQHASGDIPRGTPIADKFSGSAGEHNTPDVYGQSNTGMGLGSGGNKLDNSLDQYSGSGQGQGYGGSGQGVSGAYEGGGTRDALTGQTGHTTGAGVGVLGENLGQGQTHSHSHHQHHHERQEESHSHSHSHSHGARDAALAGTAGAAAVGAGTVGRKEYEQAYGTSDSNAATTAPLARAEGVAGLGGKTVPGVGGIQGSGIGPNDSEGERYSTERRDPGYGNLSGEGQGGHSHSGAYAAGGAGLAGAGAYGASQSHSGRDESSSSSGAGQKIAEGGLSGTGGQGVNEPGTGGGHFGRAQQDSSTGKPLSDKSVLDTGNPHSLVFDKASGEYKHRRDL